MKVISGCQNGVDQAALFAAEAVGIETGGYIPRECRTLDGPRYDLRDRFKLTVHQGYNYGMRTSDNVLWGDATLRIAENFKSPGEKCTANAIRNHCKPSFDVPLVRDQYGAFSTAIKPEHIVLWLVHNKVEILNVAGNAEPTAPGIFQFAQQYLVEVFRLWVERMNILIQAKTLADQQQN